MSSVTVSNLNKKVYGQIEAWRGKPVVGAHHYVYPDGLVFRPSRHLEFVACGARNSGVLRHQAP